MSKQKPKGENLVRVRDRRTPHQFTVHNRVIDEWYPIITAKGYALYSLYCRMASKDEERCYPGYRLIAKHMGMGQSTIADYNKLLTWCALIHIEPGAASENIPNDYYILDIPQVTSDTLQSIRQLAQADVSRLAAEREEKAQRLEQGGLVQQAKKVRQQKAGTFYAGLFKRLNQWQPIQIHWSKKKERPSIIHTDQLSLFAAPAGEHPASNGEQAASTGGASSPACEHPAPDSEHSAPRSGAEQSTATIHNNNPNQQAITTKDSAPAAAHTEELSTLILDWMGFNGRLPTKECIPPTQLLAWAYWIKLEGEALLQQGKNPVGIARAAWRRGEWPGGGLASLAYTWLTLDENGRSDLLEDADSARFRIDHRLLTAEELGLHQQAAKAFYRLCQLTNGHVAPDPLLPNLQKEGAA